MRKLCALLLATIMTFTVPMSAYATSSYTIYNPEIVVAPTMIGHATDENGNTYEIVGTLVDTIAPRSTNGTYVSTYAYDISHTNTADAPDSGYVSHVYLTIRYTLRDGNYYLLTNVSGHWDIQDYNASVTNATVEYICGQSGLSRNVSNNFSFATGFSTFTDCDASGCTVGARLNLTYKIGSSRTWTFSLPNIIYG